MRIAYFSDTFYPQINGIVTSILNSSRILAERGYEVYIFTIKTKEGRGMKLHKNIRIIYYKSIDAFRYPGYELVLPRIIHCFKEVKRIKPDIIHIHTPTLLGFEAIICGKILKIPAAGTYPTLVPDFLKHSPIPKIGEYNITKKAAWRYTNNFYEKYNITTTPSEAMKRELLKHNLKCKIEVVSNGANLELFYPRKRNNKKFRILYVGRISYEKNIDVAIKAVAEFAKQKKDFEFWIAGSGPDLEKTKKLAYALGIFEFTKIMGAIPNEKLPEIYSNSDVFITASTIETEGIVLLEAMGCGLPVVGVDARAVPDLIKNEKNGFVVGFGDYKAISGKITELYNNKKICAEIRKENIKLSKEYDLKKCVSKMLDIYNSLIQKRV